MASCMQHTKTAVKSGFGKGNTLIKVLCVRWRRGEFILHSASQFYVQNLPSEELGYWDDDIRTARKSERILVLFSLKKARLEESGGRRIRLLLEGTCHVEFCSVNGKSRYLSNFGLVVSSSGAFQVVLVVKNPPANAADKRGWLDPWAGKIPWRRAWQPTPVFLPGESHGQRSLAGYSP